MKRSIGAALLAAVAAGGKWLSGSPVLSSPGYARFRPTGAALRNRADAAQLSRILAAEDKRQRKADKLQEHNRRSIRSNKAHLGCAGGIASLNPFYIAK